MVDEERVARLLSRVTADVDALRAAGQGTGHLAGDEVALAAVKYRFVTVIERCVRVANHLCASEGWGAADTNADGVRMLAVNGVVEAAVADAVASAVGFHNVLVHQYVDVDDDRVVGMLARLDDFDRYVAQVAGWLRRDVT